METCADCGKPIELGQGSYYSKNPLDDMGRSYHSACGDPFGTKALQEKCDRYGAALTTIRDTLPERQDAYARLVFALAAGALEPEPNT